MLDILDIKLAHEIAEIHFIELGILIDLDRTQDRFRALPAMDFHDHPATGPVLLSVHHHRRPTVVSRVADVHDAAFRSVAYFHVEQRGASLPAL